MQFSNSWLEQVLQKVAEDFAIESGRLLGEKKTCFQVELPEEAHLFAGRYRGHLRLLAYGVPHVYPVAVPLKMAFVSAPELDI